MWIKRNGGIETIRFWERAEVVFVAVVVGEDAVCLIERCGGKVCQSNQRKCCVELVHFSLQYCQRCACREKEKEKFFFLIFYLKNFVKISFFFSLLPPLFCLSIIIFIELLNHIYCREEDIIINDFFHNFLFLLSLEFSLNELKKVLCFFFETSCNCHSMGKKVNPEPSL